MKESSKRLLVSGIILLITAVCLAAVVIFELETTAVKVIGSFVSVPLVSLVLWKFPFRFYFFGLVFDMFATAFGSVLNLYYYIGFYDRFVHFLSGVLLAEGGMLIIGYVFKRRKAKPDRLLYLIFSFFFSCSCAAFWEIYEFTADNLLNIAMQGNNTNTMGDIVSGVLGALAYAVIALAVLKDKKGEGAV